MVKYSTNLYFSRICQSSCVKYIMHVASSFYNWQCLPRFHLKILSQNFSCNSYVSKIRKDSTIHNHTNWEGSQGFRPRKFGVTIQPYTYHTTLSIPMQLSMCSNVLETWPLYIAIAVLVTIMHLATQTVA